MRSVIFFVGCCVLAAGAPLLNPLVSGGVSGGGGMERFPGWPRVWDGRALTELPLTEREQRLAEDFPGRIARFSDGAREIIIRWVTQPTRALHPAADCFRGVGYAVEPLPLRVDGAGARWGGFAARRGAERLRVYERIYSAEGSWSDVSSWYWAALLGRTRGAWWAVTVAEGEHSNTGE